jgi:RNA polymerase sigma factor (TIGR02999 family)
MNDLTRTLEAASRGDAGAAASLLPLVYDELRRLAAARLAHEAPGLTLQATALVHEAYLRLVGDDPGRPWDGRGHFFAAAAEAMRRILVEQARSRGRLKRGGGLTRTPIDPDELGSIGIDADELLALDDALRKFESVDPAKAALVKLRYFSGLSVPKAAESLGLSLATAERHWAYARAWLRLEVGGGDATT